MRMPHTALLVPLLLNGKQLARLRDGPLARNYFAIWLGHSPFDDDLKTSLLGS